MKDRHYLQAITVKYLSPTNNNGSRYKAFCAAGSITVHRDYGLSDSQQIAVVAGELIKKLGWDSYGKWVGGTAKNGDVVFVCRQDHCEEEL
jgi:hypothetical protein